MLDKKVTDKYCRLFLLPDYYGVDMVGLKVDCEVLGELVRFVCTSPHL